MLLVDAEMAVASGSSLAALIGQPLPMLLDTAQAVLPASAAAPNSTGSTAGSHPLAAPSAVLPAASSTAAAPAATHHQSSTLAPQLPLAPSRGQQQQTQPLGIAPQAGLPSLLSQALPVSGLHVSSSSHLPAASAVALPYSSAQQQPQAPILAALSQPPPTRGGHTPANGGQAFASGGQHVQVGVPVAVRPAGPGQLGAIGQSRATSGQQKAPVGEDVWQLASDVMAAGGTATTAAAVTTAAQQVRQLLGMVRDCLLQQQQPPSCTSQQYCHSCCGLDPHRAWC